MSRPRLEPQQFVPQTEPLLLLALIERVGERGIPARRLCADTGLDVEYLRRGLLVSRRQVWRIIRRALRMTGRPDLGLEVGRSQGLQCFGLPGHAMTAARDLMEAILIGVRYQRQGGALLDVDYAEEGDAVSLIARSIFTDPLVQRFLLEELFSSLLALGHLLLGQPVLPLRVDLDYPAPDHADRYRDVLGVMPRFGQDGNRLVIAGTWLRQPLRCRPVAPSTQLLQQLEQRDNDFPRDMVQTLEQLLEWPGLAALSIEDAARLLDLSVRTLRRRLRESGSSFREVSSRVRLRQARRLLGEQGMTVSAIGQSLGFSDARAFRQAFQRWSGINPGQFRVEAG